MNIVIPMAGSGSRFRDKGYKKPKPLIDVLGKPMIEAVIENLHVKDARYTFILNRQQKESNEIERIIRRCVSKASIVYVDGLTDGPARTALHAEKHIDEDNLIIVNCDQIIRDFDAKHIVEFAKLRGADGVVGAFISSSKKNSYMKLDPNGEVVDVKEKIVISNVATNGLHFWSKGTDFISSAKAMIENNEKYSNEFYIAPTYNYMVKNGKRVLPFFYNLHLPIGVPQDLERYIDEYGNI
tara:strand:+ start:138 stop:857 length:720 start_codon:yes stop_codon:yes gene_type:complete